MKVLIVLSSVLVLFMKQIYSENPEVIAVKNFKSITNPEVYDKDIRPHLGENKTVNVGITFHVIDYKYYAMTKEMTVHMYFRQHWNDPRLQNQMENATKVLGGKSLVDRLWIPDTFFPNSNSVEIFKYPAPNVLTRILTNGDILYSERLIVTLECTAAKNGPVNCPVLIESYGYSYQDIDYNWAKGNYSRLVADFKLRPLNNL
ncbi:unnamed protein product [Oppiella nova]|uniref:Neurotransmitter-gated ion-channel ligand-binding domain-containing protein n=1 Tax=Oppiella nova TaxID=334625 RepID=A0A7R9MBD9_9ACAR|nr:unnamed protein product [Oppiella nova]CAG2174173.1 unnamed protein product [Oppiella nova]